MCRCEPDSPFATLGSPRFPRFTAQAQESAAECLALTPVRGSIAVDAPQQPMEAGALREEEVLEPPQEPMPAAMALGSDRPASVQ